MFFNTIALPDNDAKSIEKSKTQALARRFRQKWLMKRANAGVLTKTQQMAVATNSNGIGANFPPIREEMGCGRDVLKK